MERPVERIRVSKDEPSPLRIVRKRQGKTVIIADEYNLSEEELAQVEQIANGITPILTDTESFSARYKQARDAASPKTSEGRLWAIAALGCVHDYLKEDGKSFDDLSDKVRTEVNLAVNTVGTSIDAIVIGTQRKNRYSQTYERSKKRIVKSYCLGRDIAPVWIQSGVEIVQGSRAGQNV